MADPVYGFNEADAHNLVRLIRNDRADLTETPFLPVSYTNIYIAELAGPFALLQLEQSWTVRATSAGIRDLRNNFIGAVNSNGVPDAGIVIDPLNVFGDDLGQGDRVYCVPYEYNYFLALQAPCGG